MSYGGDRANVSLSSGQTVLQRACQRPSQQTSVPTRGIALAQPRASPGPLQDLPRVPPEPALCHSGASPRLSGDHSRASPEPFQDLSTASLRSLTPTPALTPSVVVLSDGSQCAPGTPWGLRVESEYWISSQLNSQSNNFKNRPVALACLKKPSYRIRVQ